LGGLWLAAPLLPGAGAGVFVSAAAPGFWSPLTRKERPIGPPPPVLGMSLAAVFAAAGLPFPASGATAARGGVVAARAAGAVFFGAAACSVSPGFLDESTMPRSSATAAQAAAATITRIRFRFCFVPGKTALGLGAAAAAAAGRAILDVDLALPADRPIVFAPGAVSRLAVAHFAQ